MSNNENSVPRSQQEKLNIGNQTKTKILNSYESFRTVLADCSLRTTQYALYIHNDPSYDIDASFSGIGLDTMNYNVLSPINKNENEYNEESPNSNPFLSQFMVSAVNMPSRYAGVTTVNFQGRQIRMAGNAALYDPLVCMITENARCEGLKFFNSWCDEIQSIRTGLSAVSTALHRAAHCRQVYLIVFNHDTVTVFQFANAFPLLVGSLDFNWHSENTVSFPVHMSFDYIRTMGPYLRGKDSHFEGWYQLAHIKVTK